MRCGFFVAEAVEHLRTRHVEIVAMQQEAEPVMRGRQGGDRPARLTRRFKASAMTSFLPWKHPCLRNQQPIQRVTMVIRKLSGGQRMQAAPGMRSSR